MPEKYSKVFGTARTQELLQMYQVGKQNYAV